nr:glycoside hydrolase family 99-like domain-containing protein [uncultured Desulfuromonas sp.]
MKIIDSGLLAVPDFKPRSLKEPVAWCGHIPFASWLVQQLRPQIFVELGTHAGNSYFAFCQSIQHYDVNTRCYAIDTWHGDEHAGKYTEEIFEEVCRHNTQHYAAFSTLLRTTFDAAADSFSEASINLLHIDGLHTYAAVKHDFETWLPKLAPGAVVLFHDTNVRDEDFGVWQFWQELQQTYPATMEFYHSHGLGVLQLGTRGSDNTLDWLVATRDDQDLLRRYFSNLGDRLLQTIQQNKTEAELRQTLAEHQSFLQKREKELSETRQELQEQLSHVAELEKMREHEGSLLEHTRVELQQAQSGLEQAQAELTGVQDRLRTKEDDLATLQHHCEQMVNSRSWRVTAPMRNLAQRLRAVRFHAASLRNNLRNHGGLIPVIQKSVFVLKTEGRQGLHQRLRRCLKPQLAPVLAPQVSIVTGSKRMRIVPHYLDPFLPPDPARGQVDKKIAIHLHLYYADMLELFYHRLSNIPYPFDLYVSVCSSSAQAQARTQFKKLPCIKTLTVEKVPNRGRDIAPFVIQFGSRLSTYDIVGHFHTKKSPHCSQLSLWCDHILDLLLGEEQSSAHIEQIVSLLEDSAKIVYPEGQTQILKDASGWAANHAIAADLLQRYTDIDIREYPIVEFPEGTMFWARADALAPMLRLPLQWKDFPLEPIPADGTLAHALERLVLVLADSAPGKFYRLHSGDSVQDYRYYEAPQDYSGSVADDVKVLSYYLPQFHPIPENDQWHGKGFTEWTNVRSANPLFEGHYQQHIPHSDLGYYLLDTPDTLRKQARMMHAAGVSGQIFYHYWFTGKLILEQPAGMLLEHPDIDMPFCFCWANENWTRCWDGNEEDVLLRQDYSAADARAFIRYLLPFFKDQRYIRIEDRPVLFIYRPSSIPDPAQYLDIWEAECSAAGLRKPYVVAVLTRGASDPRPFGMDAGAERVLHDWTAGAVADIRDSLIPCDQPLEGSVLPYPQVADFYMSQTQAQEFTWFRSVVPNFDNTARYAHKAILLHDANPYDFSRWLRSCVDYSRRHLPAGQRFVVVNAWNEWAEGAHLEPDSRHGYAYLNAVGRVLSAFPDADCTPTAEVSPGLNLRLELLPPLQAQLERDPALKQQFADSLASSSLLQKCCADINVNLPGLSSRLRPCRKSGEKQKYDFILQFRRAALFPPETLNRMLQTALAAPESSVVGNVYGGDSLILDTAPNGAITPAQASMAPVILYPSSAPAGYLNYRLRPDASAFIADPGCLTSTDLPEVTTIIRYHKEASAELLHAALYSLAAMRDCIVHPLIAAQDLTDEQHRTLEHLLNRVPWKKGTTPRIDAYRSPGSTGDLRARMLTQTLQKVTTRYAAFLDYDDLLMPHAYATLLQRLHKTRKAVTFGRVYSTTRDPDTGRYLKRYREFTHGRTYEDFLSCNHAPLHSFLLDLAQLDVSRLTYQEGQRYLEDYYLTLQLFTRDNADWQSLELDNCIGDYIHTVGPGNTLAVTTEEQRRNLVESPHYRECLKHINELRATLR